ncbi:hypothetical protein [Variovorax sp. OAS795]|uniref:hypothetical protein n=1 Tax=Variovorax sp. OAS795 TaxID=3034231 RepID=UPI00339993AB
MMDFSSPGNAAPAVAMAAAGIPLPKSPPGMAGARSCAGAVVAHSRSNLLSGPFDDGIDAAPAASLPPQCLQKFAPSRFSVLHAGQIKAIATDIYEKRGTMVGERTRRAAKLRVAGENGEPGAVR